MKDIAIRIFVGIVLIVVGGVFGVLIQNWRDQEANRMRGIEYTIQYVDGIIQKPEFGSLELAVLLDGNPIENISSVQVNLYNRTGRDYEDVCVYVELTSTDGNDVQTVSSRIWSPAGFPKESIVPLEEIAAPETEGSIRFGYQLTTLNRSQDSYTPAYAAIYWVLGDRHAEVTIEIEKTGLQLEELEYPEKSRWLFYAILVPVWVVFMMLFLWYEGKDTKEFRANLRQAWEDELGSKDLAGRIHQVYMGELKKRKGLAILRKLRKAHPPKDSRQN